MHGTQVNIPPSFFGDQSAAILYRVTGQVDAEFAG